jgi:hypothetical protein
MRCMHAGMNYSISRLGLRSDRQIAEIPKHAINPHINTIRMKMGSGNDRFAEMFIPEERIR